MNSKINRRGAVKMLAAAGGLMFAQASAWAGVRQNESVLSGWLYQGQSCSIQQAGSTLLLINESGAVGSAIFTSKDTLLVLGGSGWDVGLTGQITRRGRTINWSNNTVWTKTSNPHSPPEIASGWICQNLPCAIFQQGNQFLLVSEVGAIGNAVWSGENRLTVIGGTGWDAGMTGQLLAGGDVIQWANNAIWIKK